MTSTWAFNLNSNDTERARINGPGYEHVDEVHYAGASIHAPVTNEKKTAHSNGAITHGWVKWYNQICDGVISEG